MSKIKQRKTKQTMQKTVGVRALCYGLGFGFQTLAALLALDAQAAGNPLTVTHRVFDAQQNADGLTRLTLEVTVRNDGAEALSDVTLRPFASMPLLPEPQTEPVGIGSVGAGQSVGVVWSAISASPVETVTPMIQRLWFGGEGNNSAGDPLAFPVESTGVAP